MRILIAGGRGFVGGRIAEYLSRQGHQVVIGSRQAKNPPAWLAHSEAALLNFDDLLSLRQACTDVEVVIHAAGMNAQDCAANPEAALISNGVHTTRLLSAACDAGVPRFIYLSTAHVYANPLVGVINEQTCSKNLHPYATSHYAGECAVLNANQRDQTDGIVLRLSNAVGTPMDQDANCWMLLVNDLCMQAVKAKQLTLQSDGSQVRDFIGLDAVCAVVSNLAARQLGNRAGGLYNLGSGISQTVFEIAQLVQQRSELVLGFAPAIARKQDHNVQKSMPLQYQLYGLRAIGIEPSSNIVQEVDRLLVYCKKVFASANLSEASR
jgi:UDP-glucose 4-epimerase